MYSVFHAIMSKHREIFKKKKNLKFQKLLKYFSVYVYLDYIIYLSRSRPALCYINIFECRYENKRFNFSFK